jgi:hypothetical protein
MWLIGTEELRVASMKVLAPHGDSMILAAQHIGWSSRVTHLLSER